MNKVRYQIVFALTCVSVVILSLSAHADNVTNLTNDDASKTAALPKPVQINLLEPANASKKFTVDEAYAITNDLEQKSFGKTFESNDILTRLIALETKWLGSAKLGAFSPRLNAVQMKVNEQFFEAEAAKKIVDDSMTQIEQHFLNASYPQDNVDKRLQRVEEKVFGKQQTGTTTKRLDSLLMKM